MPSLMRQRQQIKRRETTSSKKVRRIESEPNRFHVGTRKMVNYALNYLAFLFVIAIGFVNIYWSRTTETIPKQAYDSKDEPVQQRGSERKEAAPDIPEPKLLPRDSENRNTTNTTPSVSQEESPDDAIAWSNVTTLGYYNGGFYAGFRNQMMAFTMLILYAVQENHGQMVLETIGMKDTYGSNKNIPFHTLWDIPHWNSHYPQLPRLVHYNHDLHDQLDPETLKWYRRPDGNWTDRDNSTTYDTLTRPFAFGYQHRLMAQYKRYAKGNGPFANNGHRNPLEILMLNGAMRPHPKLRAIIDHKLHSLGGGDGANGGGSSSSENIEYMTLHARVEPDMQRHRVCWDQKVLNLTDIFDFMEKQWPDPPVKHIFMPINREFLEKEGSDEVVENLKKRNKEINWIAVGNLRALNRARDEGLWNGRAKVFEFGARALENTEYSHRPSTTGALVNFFIGINAKIFIGTEVSTYSHDILATRFFRDNMENYKYLPDGLHHWTPPGLEDPPGFLC